MLTDKVRNAFSAQSECLLGQVTQLALDHHPRIAPLEELERWLVRRSQVLNLQRSLLSDSMGPEALASRYRNELDELQRQIVARFREMIEARIPDRVTVHIVDDSGDAMIPLDAAEVARRVEQFERRVEDEMAVHRQFSFGTGQARDNILGDLQQEWESIERTLDTLKEQMDACNLPAVEASASILEQLAALRRDHDMAIRDAGHHQAWWDSCTRGEIGAVTVILDNIPAERRPGFVNRLAPNGRSAFHMACENQDLAVAALLLRSGADLLHPTDIGRLPMQLAARHNMGERTVTFLRWLKAHGADPHVRDENGRGALNEAAHYGNVRAAIWLLSEGMQVSEVDHAGRTPLHVAAARGRADFVRWLLERGADHRARNAAGERAIFEAVRVGHDTCMQAFLDAGIWLDAAERQQLRSQGMLGAPEVQRAYGRPLQQALAMVSAEPVAGASASGSAAVRQNTRSGLFGWLGRA